MTQKAAELLASALSLSEEEREDIAENLWASLKPPDDQTDLTEEEFAAELDRRAAELKADPSQGVPWEVVRNMR